MSADPRVDGLFVGKSRFELSDEEMEEWTQNGVLGKPEIGWERDESLWKSERIPSWHKTDKDMEEIVEWFSQLSADDADKVLKILIRKKLATMPAAQPVAPDPDEAKLLGVFGKRKELSRAEALKLAQLPDGVALFRALVRGNKLIATSRDWAHGGRTLYRTP
jgi:hypothetical protein